jgi:hypothetical protein
MPHRISRSLALMGSILIAISTALAPSAPAQNAAWPFTVPLKEGGVLHVGDGTWTPWTEGDPAPGSTIYSNTALHPGGDARVGYFKGAHGTWEYGDWGRIPGPTSPAPEAGTHNGYKITGFKFAYFTKKERTQFRYRLRFFDKYMPCNGPVEMVEVGNLLLADLPGAPVSGTPSAWVVTIDLRGGQEFCMRSDGGDDWFNNFVVSDSFAWSFHNDTLDSPGGPILAGDPLGTFGPAADEGDGTVWHGDIGSPGTGLGTEATLWRRDAGSEVNPTCFNLSSNPDAYASFYMQIYADLEAPPCGSTFSNAIGTNYCDQTVPNSTGELGEIHATGSTLMADDDLTLWAVNMPQEHSVGYFLMGNGQSMTTPPGSVGQLCLEGGDVFVRLLPDVNYTDDTVGGFRRVLGTAGPFTAGITAGTTWNFQAWHRDGTADSNMTNAVSILFQ